jgi:hypothetical protein
MLLLAICEIIDGVYLVQIEFIKSGSTRCYLKQLKKTNITLSDD